MPDLWLATGHGAAGLFHDDRGLVEVLASHGIVAAPASWQTIVPDGTPILIRSVWDYTVKRAAFEAWLTAIRNTQTPCINPVDRVFWNLDKRYLLELQDQGHAIVETHVLPHFDAAEVAALGRRHGWTKSIAKPVVGAAAEGLSVVENDGTIHGFDLSGLTWAPDASKETVGPCLVQPFLPEIWDGEWSLFYFGGTYSHAIIKRPRAGDIRVQEEHGGVTEPAEPTAAIRAAAGTLAAVVPDAVYARVDGVVVGNQFQLMELELIEPELYFRYAPGALERFGAAVAVELDTR